MVVVGVAGVVAGGICIVPNDPAGAVDRNVGLQVRVAACGRALRSDVLCWLENGRRGPGTYSLSGCITACCANQRAMLPSTHSPANPDFPAKRCGALRVGDARVNNADRDSLAASRGSPRGRGTDQRQVELGDRVIPSNPAVHGSGEH